MPHVRRCQRLRDAQQPQGYGPPPLGGLSWADCDCDQPDVLTVDDPGYSEAVSALTAAMEAAGWKVTRHGNRAALGA